MARPSSKSLILDSAAELMAKHGLSTISLRRINEETGLSPAAVHYHFKNKQSLVKAVLLRHMRESGIRNKKILQLLNQESPLNNRSFIQAVCDPLITVFIEDDIYGEYFAQITFELFTQKSQELADYIPDEFRQMENYAFEAFCQLKPKLSKLEQALHFQQLELAWAGGMAQFRQRIKNIDQDYRPSLKQADIVQTKKNYIAQLQQSLIGSLKSI